VTIPASGGVALVEDTLLMETGDLLFNRTNSSALVGKVGLYRGSDSAITFASYFVRMRPRPKHMPEYLNMVLNDISILSIVRREAIPSLHQSNLNPTRYGRLQIALPPLEEQRKILHLVRKRTCEPDRAIATAYREISLLREYRTRLIADVVTGKLDVREAAARLPDEVDELELLDDVEETADNVTDDSVEEVADAG
jgi:type I restriction enzyme S subunit